MSHKIQPTDEIVLWRTIFWYDEWDDVWEEDVEFCVPVCGLVTKEELAAAVASLQAEINAITPSPPPVILSYDPPGWPACDIPGYQP